MQLSAVSSRQKHSIVCDGFPFVDPSGRLSSSLNRFLNHLVSRIKFLYLVRTSWRCGGLIVTARARPRVKSSALEPRPETLCCVLGQDSLLSQCLSPPRCINGVRAKLTRGDPAMDISSRGSRKCFLVNNKYIAATNGFKLSILLTLINDCYAFTLN